MEVLQYQEKWHKANDPYFGPLTCVDFSKTGKYIAFGSGVSVLLVDVVDGALRTMVRNRYSPVISLYWCYPEPEEIVCAFADGTIANVSISPTEVCPSPRPRP